jgi:hypothetical protein
MALETATNSPGTNQTTRIERRRRPDTAPIRSRWRRCQRAVERRAGAARERCDFLNPNSPCLRCVNDAFRPRYSMIAKNHPKVRLRITQLAGNVPLFDVDRFARFERRLRLSSNFDGSLATMTFRKSRPLSCKCCNGRRARGGMRFALIVHHADGEREWAYDRQSSIGRWIRRLTQHGRTAGPLST